ncbi:V-type ATP synthase subunit I [Thermoplasma sp.]|uniref:V-type ATP synthase subunit I n=1 Tax=Thermoplasma sp. TaxID=1973142 RepID=UPI00126D9B17|nr:V-type ATP synthase subunit I [Thermoplasma sp.]KAA8922032.1 MAG: V-type ATP synthase subunit I [Thermoplasma sp.]
MLRPVRMEKIRIIAPYSYRDAVISALHDLGVMQIEEIREDVDRLLSPGRISEQAKTVMDYLQKFRGYENILPKRPVSTRARFSSLSDILSEASKINIDEDVRIAVTKENDIAAAIKDIDSRLAALEYMKGYDFDVSIFNGKHFESYIIPDRDIDTKAFSTLDAEIIPLKNAFIITVAEDRTQDLSRIANSIGVRLIHIPNVKGKPDDVISMLQEERKKLEQAMQGITRHLGDLSDKYYERIAQIREALEIEAKKIEVEDKLKGTEYTFAVEGWIPADSYGRVSDTINRVTANSCIISRVKTDEIPPTLLRNPRRISLFEFFIKFYSLPEGTEYDPTLIFALVFPVFFGLMVGDWGYGLAILLLSLFIIHRVDHPPAKSHIPRVISRFVLMIMSPQSLKILAKALIPSSIVAMIAGILFNQFFGFAILPFTVFHVYAVLPKLMLIAGYIGLGMVVFGFILGFIEDLWMKDVKGAMDRLGWLFFAVGIATIGLNLIHHDLTFSVKTGISNMIAVALIVIGIPLIAIKEKSQGFIEMPSIISHILSYLRLVGILIASVVIAEIIDLVFMRSIVSHSIGLAIAGVVILIFGQMFNLILAVFEPGIQGARLIYVEFFSKFYHGNGRMFRPFKSQRKYTENGIDLEKVR